MKFSFLTPTRNRRRFLPHAIRAAIDMAWQDWEMLISPWGDDVTDLIPNDPRIRLIPRESENLAETLNHLTAEATGDVLNFCADDDVMPDDALSAVATFLRSNKWLVGRMLQNGSLQGGKCTLSGLLNANTIPCPAVYWTRETAALTGPWAGDAGLALDWDYWIRMWQTCGEPKFIDHVLSTYGCHPEQVSNLQYEQVRTDAGKVKGRYAIWT